jgi:hypothetical protein
MKQQPEVTVNKTQDERPPDWAYQKSLKMHQERAEKVDRFRSKSKRGEFFKSLTDHRP